MKISRAWSVLSGSPLLTSFSSQRVKDELGEVAEGFFLEFLQTFVLPVEPQSPQRSQVDVPETQPTQQTPIYVTQVTHIGLAMIFLPEQQYVLE